MLFLPLLPSAACASAGVQDTVVSRPDHAGLTDTQAAMVASAARQALSGEAGKGSKLTSATAVLTKGRVGQSATNTGHACTSGRILKVVLIGSFPHISTAGDAPHEPAPVHASSPNAPATETSDGDVHGMLLSVDATTGALCLIGVETGDVNPLPNSTALKVG